MLKKYQANELDEMFGDLIEDSDFLHLVVRDSHGEIVACLATISRDDEGKCVLELPQVRNDVPDVLALTVNGRIKIVRT
jgi:hypothetical protein